MVEKFTICLIHDKDDIQNIIDTGNLNITLEDEEIELLENSLSAGLSEVILRKKSAEDIKREKLLDVIDSMQETLDDIREELSN